MRITGYRFGEIEIGFHQECHKAGCELRRPRVGVTRSAHIYPRDPNRLRCTSFLDAEFIGPADSAQAAERARRGFRARWSGRD
jgi:hypothetical protein